MTDTSTWTPDQPMISAKGINRSVGGLEVLKVEGQEVNDPNLDKLQLRKKVGMVFQHYNLFPYAHQDGPVGCEGE